MRHVTAADVIAGTKVDPIGPAVLALPLRGMMLRWQARGMAVATTTILVQRAFAEGLRDADGGPVDPSTTTVETRHDEDGTVRVRLLPRDRAPVEMSCAPGGYLTVHGCDGRRRPVEEWRDLPDVLPAFLTA